MTFEELAEWAGAEISSEKICSEITSHFFYLNCKYDGYAIIEFYDDGRVVYNRDTGDDDHAGSDAYCELFYDRTPEQMKQIIIAGGLKDD